MNANTEPKLAPPGAGLPRPELYIARWLFGWRRRTGNREAFNALFQRERGAIRQLVSTCQGDDGARRVLIRRPRGLEDSSRYWSVWMTLDHLRIVNQSMTRVIKALTNGVKLEGSASTANVKPTPEATAAVLAEYEQACDTLLATVAAAGNLKTAGRYAHPWFGRLDAAGWHALAGGHMGIHRVQLERILAGISAGRG
jgi:hypothetical protein